MKYFKDCASNVHKDSQTLLTNIIINKIMSLANEKNSWYAKNNSLKNIMLEYIYI